ncbi:S-layer homology domain-containing protein, partial [Candidatus Saccharibacteria bacterium]|nr:S-layer homology domain-containing protein [Candidatus Saccharibacteria bacterium]
MLKKKVVALSLIVLVMFSLSTPAMAAKTPTFSDVTESHWAFACIESCYTKGLMQGVGGGKFDPNRLVTNAEMVQTLYNIYKDRTSDMVDPPHLNDVAEDAWYHDAAYWAVRSGIANYSSRPGNPVAGETDYMIYSFVPSLTIGGRMTAVAYLGRLADALGVTLPKTVAAVTFPDAEFYYLEDSDGNPILSERRNLAPSVTAYIYALQRAGIVSGYPDGTFRPNYGLTRAEW